MGISGHDQHRSTRHLRLHVDLALSPLTVTAEIHLLAGLNGAGKTTHARHLAATLQADRFNLDEWMRQLYALSFDDELYPVNLRPREG